MISFLRSFTVLFFFVLFGFGAGVINFVLFPLGKIFAKNKKLYYSSIIHGSWKFFIRVLEVSKIIRLDISSRDELGQISGKIIVSTHPSLIDIVILTGLIPKTVCIAKKQLLNNPLFGNILKAIYITNDVDIEEFKNNATAALQEGYNVVIFPTGKRTGANENLKIHKGAALLAIASGVPIVPISMKTSYSFLGIGQPIYDCGNKSVVYTIKQMPEINPATLVQRDISEAALRNLVSKKIKENIS